MQSEPLAGGIIVGGGSRGRKVGRWLPVEVKMRCRVTLCCDSRCSEKGS